MRWRERCRAAHHRRYADGSHGAANLGSVSEFEKANLVAKLKGARDRQSVAQGHAH
jgi:hypothetical protein